MVTGLFGFLTMPFMALTGKVAASNSKRPDSTWTNSTLSPVEMPSAARTVAGIVICPLLVIVDVAIINPKNDCGAYAFQVMVSIYNAITHTRLL
jgi:hypothetical protein